MNREELLDVFEPAIRKISFQVAEDSPYVVGPGFPLAVFPEVKRLRPDIVRVIEAWHPDDDPYQSVTLYIPRRLRGG